MPKSKNQERTKAYKEYAVNVEKLMDAIEQDDADKEIIYLTQVIHNLQEAKIAKIMERGGVAQ